MATLQDYVEARQRRDKAAERAQETIDYVHEGASLLKNWREVRVSNVERGFQSKTGIWLDGSKWPDANKLAARICDFLDADEKLKMVFSSLSPQDRNRVSSV